VSYKDVPVAEEYEMEEIESGLAYVDLTGMIDPARVEVFEAIKVTHHAGINTVMVTGEHRLTAVAKEIGVLEEMVPGSVMTGEEVEEIDDVRVFTRFFSKNRMLFISIMASVAMQLAILYITALNPIFKVITLTPFELFVCFLGSLTAFLIILGKMIPRRRYVSHRIV
jgi:magnesium-transporting ATPase (P-type)